MKILIYRLIRNFRNLSENNNPEFSDFENINIEEIF